jgi:ATP-binding cassette subfamily C protein LapB/adhesin transport system membrane fusion protein
MLSDYGIAESVDYDYDYYERWKEAIVQIAHHYRLDISEQNILSAAQWYQESARDDVLKMMAKQAGMMLKTMSANDFSMSNWILPVVVEMAEGRFALIKSIAGNNDLVCAWADEMGLLTTLTQEEFQHAAKRIILLRPLKNVADPRIDD